MSQQKAFYEIEKPAKVTYRVNVTVEDEGAKREGYCEHLEPFFNAEQKIIGYLFCGAGSDEIGDDVFLCECCKRWFCSDHLDMRDEFCLTCTELPSGIREEVKVFQKSLNR